MNESIKETTGNNTSGLNSSADAIQQSISTIKIKKNDLGLIYNSNVVNNNFLVDFHLKQLLQKQSNLNVFDLVLLNNHYGNITFIIGVFILFIAKFIFLRKGRFKKAKMEFEFHLIQIIFTSLVAFGFFLGFRKLAIFFSLLSLVWIIYIHHKGIYEFLEQIFFTRNLNIALDTSLEEDMARLDAEKLTNDELMSLELGTYKRSSKKVINLLIKKYFNLVGLKIIDMINIILMITLIVMMGYVFYFLSVAYQAGLLEWFYK